MRSLGDSEHSGRRNFRAGLSLLVGAALLLYPLLVYFGAIRLGVHWMAVAVITTAALRLAATLFGAPLDARAALGAPQLLLICGGAIVLALVSAWRDSPDAMLYYPAFVNAVMLLLFATSVVWPPTVVERIARLRDEDLPPEAVSYLRRVTAAWCVFFVANGAVALYTAARASFETWALYNGLIAYVLISAMFAGEFLIRMRAMRGLRK